MTIGVRPSRAAQSRAWTSGDDLKNRLAVRAPVKSVAARVLDEYLIKARKRGRQIKELEQRDCHRLRIALKKLRYASEINGGNTSVAEAEAELAQARYYLDNTTLVAPEDGHIINLQVRPGMVAGDYRIGAIASFICDDGRYLLAAYFQEILKYMTNGQPVEVALDLYPGQIFHGKVESIWKASGEGQYLPSGTLPVFHPDPPKVPQGCFAVAILFDDPDQSKFPIGAQGVAAVYTRGMTGPWAALRRVSIRITSWMNWLYPMPF